jgi:hypothetical protein
LTIGHFCALTPSSSNPTVAMPVGKVRSAMMLNFGEPYFSLPISAILTKLVPA